VNVSFPMTQIVCKGLLFDMDGVLVDSTPAVARVWSRWAQEHGFDPELATKLAHGRPSLATIQDLLPNASADVHHKENAWMEREEIADVADVVALPGALELLSRLSPEQFAVVTSATRALAEVRLRAGGLLKYAQRMITSGDIQRGKPDPEPYLKGAAKLQLRPADCVVIEDAPSGVRSGKGAGARVIALRTTTSDAELLAAGADWIVDDCSEITIASISSVEITVELVDSPNERRVPKMS
jgi:mannitol-1-/sugar-/sorbitol-6-phosphatase